MAKVRAQNRCNRVIIAISVGTDAHLVLVEVLRGLYRWAHCGSNYTREEVRVFNQPAAVEGVGGR